MKVVAIATAALAVAFGSAADGFAFAPPSPAVVGAAKVTPPTAEVAEPGPTRTRIELTPLVVVGSILGLLIIVGVMVVAVRLLRQPTYRYQGDPTPRDRRSFRETMLTWMMGPRH